MRITRYIILLVATILWSCGLSGGIEHWLYDLGLITDNYRFGDLYQFAYLPQFKQEQPVYPVSNRSSDTASTHLYIIGDSFTRPQILDKSDFRVSHYKWWGQNPPIPLELDNTKRNILLIESIERNFRENFTQPVTQLNPKNDTNQTQNRMSSLTERLGRKFHRRVEARLESALFNHNLFLWFKELKASLTLNWFDRVDPMVSLSKDRKNLFFFMDTDTSLHQTSSFSGLTDHEVNSLVTSINSTANRYRCLGFDEVYLSIIPNKASILETNRSDYNHLIERIQDNPQLKVPTINTYEAFKRSPVSPYLKSDTHWNCEGYSLWLNLVRLKLHI